jgi:hypothetical protein
MNDFNDEPTVSKGAILGYLVLAVVVIMGLTWILQGNDFFMYKVFGLRYEQTRREIFEQSKAYRQGMIQELQNMQFSYEQASPASKEALASIILHRAADVDETILPADLKSFIEQLKTDAKLKSDTEGGLK